MDIEGVIDVKNEMPLPRSAKEKRSLGDKIDDSSISAQVKISLLYHRSTSGIMTKVETKDGVVTLHSAAKNSAEKDMATKFAQDVNGVKSLDNMMTIE